MSPARMVKTGFQTCRYAHGHMGTPRSDAPIRQRHSVGDGGKRAACLLGPLAQARHHGLGVYVEATATRIEDLPRRLRG